MSIRDPTYTTNLIREGFYLRNYAKITFLYLYSNTQSGEIRLLDNMLIFNLYILSIKIKFKPPHETGMAELFVFVKAFTVVATKRMFFFPPTKTNISTSSNKLNDQQTYHTIYLYTHTTPRNMICFEL